MVVKKIEGNKTVWGFRYRYKIKNKWHKKEVYNRKWSKREAEQEEINFIKLINKPKGDILFSELYEMYFDFKSNKIKLRAYNDIMTSCNKHILPYFSDLMLDDVNTHEIEMWQKKLLKTTYTKSDKKHLYSNRQLEKIQINLNAMFNFAFDRELIDRNPMKALGISKRREEPKKDEERIITVEEFSRIIEAIKISDYKSNDEDEIKFVKSQDMVIFSILFWCGLRKGEMMALDIKDYNFITKELSIYKNWDYVNKVMTTPKTTNSIRTVIVPDIVDKYIISLVALYRKLPDFSIDHALVSFHKRLAPTTLTRKKDKYCKLAGIKGISIHSFRHSHVSLLINSGLQPFEIAKRLGHTVEMVNEVYGHMYPSKQKEMVELMNKIN